MDEESKYKVVAKCKYGSHAVLKAELNGKKETFLPDEIIEVTKKQHDYLNRLSGAWTFEKKGGK